MAKIIPYLTNDGVFHPESYWKFSEANLNVNQRFLCCKFVGFHDESCCDSRKAPIGFIEFICINEEFDKIYKEHISGKKNLAECAYAIADSQNKQRKVLNEKTGEEEIINGSFFEMGRDLIEEVAAEAAIEK